MSISAAPRPFQLELPLNHGPGWSSPGHVHALNFWPLRMDSCSPRKGLWMVGVEKETPAAGSEAVSVGAGEGCQGSGVRG